MPAEEGVRSTVVRLATPFVAIVYLDQPVRLVVRALHDLETDFRLHRRFHRIPQLRVLCAQGLYLVALRLVAPRVRGARRPTLGALPAVLRAVISRRLAQPAGTRYRYRFVRHRRLAGLRERGVRHFVAFF